MPNTCINDLTVTGPKKEIDRFIQAAQGTEDFNSFPFSLESLFPMPKHINPQDLVNPRTPGENGLNWHCENWGTKWDITEFINTVRDKEDEVFYSFITANSPCDNAFTKKIAADFPELTFHLSYIEINAEYEGTCDWTKGKLVKEWFNPQADMKAFFADDAKEDEDEAE